MDDAQFHQLLDHFHLSRAGFRKVRKGVKKRLGRRLREVECRDVAAYLNLVREDSDERGRCRLLLLVPITRFFRDRQVWVDLETHFLPGLIQANPRKIRAWSAGCSGGEEPYSLAMAWERVSADLEKQRATAPALSILATDLHPAHLERARTGLYPLSSLREVKEEDRAAFFIRRKKQFQVQDRFREYIAWKILDLEGPALPGPFDLVFLRNSVLTYLEGDKRETAAARVAQTLAPGGLLVVGAHEKLPGLVAKRFEATINPLVWRKF